MMMEEKFIGLNGVLYVLQNQLEVWGFEISKSSIMHCLLNRCGVSIIDKTPSFLKYLVLSISSMVIFLRRLFILNALMHGIVFFRHEKLLKKGLYERLAMES